MSTDYEPEDVSGGISSQTTINDNFDSIQTALNAFKFSAKT